jgi:hypothetical protein
MNWLQVFRSATLRTNDRRVQCRQKKAWHTMAARAPECA